MFYVYIYVFVIFLQGSDGVIYRVNDSLYALMPPLMHLDSYEACQVDTDALYCSAEFALVSDQPNPLLTMIKEYSDHHVSHYNHTKLRYGICVTQTCMQFYDKNNLDPKYTLEACLNQTLSENYNLKVQIEGEYHCKDLGQTRMDIDTLDIYVAAICLIFLLACLVGSLYEILCNTNDGDVALRIVLCFSLKRNWKKLISPGGEDQPRLEILQGLHGIRAITMALVIIAHSMLAMVAALQNPEFLEEVIYITRPFYILLNGMLVMHTFLLMSSFLLVYKWLLHSEKHRSSWSMLPKNILNRWLRLTPGYAFVLALTSTWFRHIVSGPLWSKFVATEMRDCRKYWWQHIFYLNNYLDNTACMVQTWYLAVDMQLYIIAVIIYLATRAAKSRKIVMPLLLVIGMIIPAAHVYFQDLEGIQIISPELILSLFFTDPHFNIVYKRGHTNITGCVIGMTMAFLAYHCQKEGVTFKKYQTFANRLLYRCLFLLALLCCYSGCIFYADAPRPSVYISTIYAAFLKPAFAMFIGGTIIGCIFKFEDLYRSVLEWHGWTIPSRLSYSAYLLHVVVIRSYVASITQTTRHNYISMFTLNFNILMRSFAIAFIFWMLVEAPINNVIKCLREPKAVYKKENKAKSS